MVVAVVEAVSVAEEVLGPVGEGARVSQSLFSPST